MRTSRQDTSRVLASIDAALHPTPDIFALPKGEQVNWCLSCGRRAIPRDPRSGFCCNCLAGMQAWLRQWQRHQMVCSFCGGYYYGPSVAPYIVEVGDGAEVPVPLHQTCIRPARKAVAAVSKPKEPDPLTEADRKAEAVADRWIRNYFKSKGIQIGRPSTKQGKNK